MRDFTFEVKQTGGIVKLRCIRHRRLQNASLPFQGHSESH
jgi:hypothetical protein